MTFTVNREALAWAGGLFEGEGCVHYYKHTQSGVRRLVAQLVTTDKDVIDRFCSVVQVGRIYGPRRVGSNKPYWSWTTTRHEEAQAVVAMLWAWLGERRRVKCKDCLTAYNSEIRESRKRMKMPSSRLTPAQVIEVRRLAATGMSQTAIAQQFDRTASGINRVVRGNRQQKVAA